MKLVDQPMMMTTRPPNTHNVDLFNITINKLLLFGSVIQIQWDEVENAVDVDVGELIEHAQINIVFEDPWRFVWM